MFIWLLEALQKYNIFGVVSFLLPFVLFCYHAFRMKQNKVEKIERERYVEEHESEEASAEKNEASSSSDEEDVDETDAKTIDLTKTNYFHSSNLICDESFEANSERIEDYLLDFYRVEDALVVSNSSVMNCLTVLCEPNSLVCCDEKINEKLREELLNGNFKLMFFRHNNPFDLKLQISAVTRNRKMNSVFVVLEVIYGQTGSVCDLKNFWEVSEELQMKIVLDVSVSFGVYGFDGRKVKCDLLVGDLGACGYFCAGSKAIMERLRDAWCLTSKLVSERPSTGNAKLFQVIKERSFDLQLLAERVHGFLMQIKQYEVVSDCISPLKIFSVAIDSTRENYDKTVRDFCKERSVHLLLNENGLLMYLNIDLCCDEIKLARLFNILGSAARFCVEKEQLMQML